MELRRRRGALVLGLVFFATGAFVLGCFEYLTVLGWIVGLLALLVGGGVVLAERRPFRFHIGPNGMVLRVASLNRAVPWTEVDAIVLDQQVPTIGEKQPISSSLLLVPPTNSFVEGPLDGRSPVDGRPALILLDLADVRQSVDEVAAALARFAGSRFTDVRHLRRARFDSPDFNIRPGGYEPAQVDDLIRQGRDGLLIDQLLPRWAAKATFERARAELPASELGYDRTEVDSLLDELSVLIARSPSRGTQAG
ncbi:hypothetical protein SAMN05443287_11073 [Micromonospora phaseoli]|uniref:Uncharacterized protein n=1 Tax=Micromonospora phaseoli TaxID=1144548 RepID=A0A1H7CPX3_9ACTN|nr:hypothetical protein [Micromonospora phaseoli]PZV91618.1 hypothetical protein CLV64_111137 [Micromonospora phaseoli]GIJ79250.1 hypothetical protein Xph01_36820 [Micromonospora phaseoli]SEJ91689.1 hypothetical protein SAMN05443287_11073 [Micromonospora phaseoli]